MSAKDKAVLLYRTLLQDAASETPTFTESLTSELLADAKAACAEAKLEPRAVLASAAMSLGTQYPSLDSVVIQLVPQIEARMKE